MTEDSGIEEDFLNDHFVTSSELDSVIEVILTCPYLIENDTGKDLTKDETFAHLDKYCSDNDAQEGFKDFMVDHLDKIMVSKLNKSQFHALLEDIQDIYDEPRRKIEATEESMQFDNDDIDDEEFQEIKSDKEAEESDTLSPTTSNQSKSLDFLREIEEFQFSAKTEPKQVRSRTRRLLLCNLSPQFNGQIFRHETDSKQVICSTYLYFASFSFLLPFRPI